VNVQKAPAFPPVSDAGGTKASPPVLPPMTADANLRLLIEAWPMLPDAMKAGILAMVNAAAGCKNERR
jgi:hypothetical protein